MEKVVEKKQSLLFTMKPLSFEKMGDKLIRVSCYLLGLGINRNGSNITKEAVLKANGKLAHLPVVGHLILDESDGSYYIGGHDVKIEDRGRDWSIEPLTVALGCVAGDSKFEFVKLKEFCDTDKEEEREYLKVEFIIWNHMSPVFEAAYDKNVYFSQSIEIDEVVGEFDSTNNFRIDSFEYSKCCLLGLSDDPKKNVIPCFPESKVYPTDYSLNEDFNKQFALLMQEIQTFNSTEPEQTQLSTDNEIKKRIKNAAKKNKNSESVLDNNNTSIMEEQNNKKEGENMSKEKILFSEVCAKLKEFIAEKTFTYNGEVFQKYEIYSINESDTSVTLVDREGCSYEAAKFNYIASQTDEGLSTIIDFENKTDMSIVVGDKVESAFDVKTEVETMIKNVSTYQVKQKEDELVEKYEAIIAEKDVKYGEITAEVDTLKKHLAVYENEKKEYMAKKHRDEIDTLIRSKAEEMDKFSEFIMYRNEINYSKDIATVEKELKEIRYNFLDSKSGQTSKKFSAIETEVVEDSSSDDNATARWGENITKHLKKSK